MKLLWACVACGNVVFAEHQPKVCLNVIKSAERMMHPDEFEECRCTTFELAERETP